MRPHWITVEPAHGPSILNLGAGITATSEADARAMFALAFGTAHRLAQIRAVMAADELDQKHVVPNMGDTGPHCR